MLYRDAGAPRSRPAEKHFRTAPHVISAQQSDTTILLDVRRGQYYTLNGVGGRIWYIIAEGATLNAIVERLADEFEVSPEQLSSDVHDFVEHLSESKLITG